MVKLTFRGSEEEFDCCCWCCCCWEGAGDACGELVALEYIRLVEARSGWNSWVFLGSCLSCPARSVRPASEKDEQKKVNEV
jgi:hypothetical protein